MDGSPGAVLVPRSRLVRELAALGVKPGDVMMVHCRMSALGNVVGGAETVVRGLLDAVAPNGTIMAYIGWQDEPPENLDRLSEEARRIYLEEHPAYDPRVALSRRDHGRVPEAMRTWPGARHSGHPEAGVTAIGPFADALASEQPYNDAYGAGTPYSRLVEASGKVLMLGAPLDTVTLVHHAEAIANVPNKRRVSYGAPVLAKVAGERQWRTFSDINTSDGALPYERIIGDEDYVEHIARAALASGAGRSGPVGQATAYLFDARLLVTFAASWIEQHFSAE